MNGPLTVDRLLDPVANAIGVDGAQRVASLRADSEASRRIAELAEKANEGRLTPEELEEYETCVRVSDIISILQAKARKLVRAAPN